ncbi:MAG: UbiD family decarboxylase [Candidatus Tectomicrobia bacterium]|nr:UbiD family decarboxylase [Candidatus Tectomicrobia bacterium]
MPYVNLRQYLESLERAGLLRRIAVEVDKDWEIAAVAKRLFQRLPEARRPGLLFERVRGFSIPVAAGVFGASPEVYATALECRPEEIHARWRHAFSHPLPPRVVAHGACKEHILRGEAADLTSLPVPTWTVGEDPSPYITAGQVISTHPDTGLTNVGVYRLQIKGPRRAGLFVAPGHGMSPHLARNEALGRPTPVAVVLGSEPTCVLTAASQVPPDMEEYAVAGGLRGAPVDVVRCETNDLFVPAEAEIVIEGIVPAGEREMEGPFGEYTGYMGPAGASHVLEVTCVTHRREPIYPCFVSEMPPSESSLIRGVGRAAALYEHLAARGFPVTDVYLPPEGGAAAWLLIVLRQGSPCDVEALTEQTWKLDPTLGKFTVLLDEDINPRNSFEVHWALAFRLQPRRDSRLIADAAGINLDPSLADPSLPPADRFKVRSSKLLLDARKKHPYPARSVPPPQHFAEVDRRWSSYGLP